MENLPANSQIHERPLKHHRQFNYDKIVSIAEFAETLNDWGGKGVPFLFLIDFEMKKPLVFSLDEIRADQLLFDLNGRTNATAGLQIPKNIDFIKFPPAFKDYKEKFDKVCAHLTYGDSYLTNLTIKTKVRTGCTLREIFSLSQARYKVLYEDTFLVFSPETFVKMCDGKIFAYPMKGTIDAAVPGAREKILADKKEMAEHVTIVDLIRNDLSAVAENVQVVRFRYVDEIRTTRKSLLQISSEIRGDLPADYREHLGDILVKLLPAGSVSGAPKCKTLEIIREAENEPRGYYTGVAGIFDGSALDSGVMIRFVEWAGDAFYYRSGGGLTVQSNAETEYQEIIDKIYVPIN